MCVLCVGVREREGGREKKERSRAVVGRRVERGRFSTAVGLEQSEEDDDEKSGEVYKAWREREGEREERKGKRESALSSRARRTRLSTHPNNDDDAPMRQDDLHPQLESKFERRFVFRLCVSFARVSPVSSLSLRVAETERERTRNSPPSH